jgi:cyclopropane fatty-acyl-phospholipid synthase-like methyltransferase
LSTTESVGIDYFSVFGRWLVEGAQLVPGERVLDVGCGRGAVTIPAAIAVGATGHG